MAAIAYCTVHYKKCAHRILAWMFTFLTFISAVSPTKLCMVSYVGKRLSAIDDGASSGIYMQICVTHTRNHTQHKRAPTYDTYLIHVENQCLIFSWQYKTPWGMRHTLCVL